MFIIYVRVILMHRKRQLETIRIIISLQQTLKDVEHIHRDIAGFDMSYEEFKCCAERHGTKNSIIY